MSAQTDNLARIYRGPCGGWHYDGYPKSRGRRGHRVHCQACVRLGSLSLRPRRDFARWDEEAS